VHSPDRRYRIAHFSQDFARGKSQLGGFSRIFNICGDANEHIVFTIATGITALDEFTTGPVRVVAVPVPVIPRGRVDQVRLRRRVADAIVEYLQRRRIAVDLFFGHSQLWNFFVLQRVRGRYSPDIPLLWEANALWGTVESQSVRHFLANQLNLQVQRYVFQHADAVICQTESARRLIVERFGVEASRCTVITNAVAAGEPARSRRPSTRPYRMLCLGLFDEMNGIPFLVDAWKRSPEPGLQLTFIGDGKFRPEVEQVCSDGRCEYAGSLPYAAMQARFAEFDLVVIPRLPRPEAHLFIPTKLLEAMHHGVVPICSDVRAMQDVIQDGENGFLFRAADEHSLRAVLHRAAGLDPNELANLAAAAQRTVRESYDWNVNHRRLAAVYSKLVR
jgi:glycosyltransferase involved in cell wall biosynthesis